MTERLNLVLRMLASGPMTDAEIADRLQAEPADVRKSLRRYAESGHIRRGAKVPSPHKRGARMIGTWVLRDAFTVPAVQREKVQLSSPAASIFEPVESFTDEWKRLRGGR